jgi:5-methyltetrahydrofolate--homocysteine methyltransferase
LGTVKGDVHDVGKNLVDIILTNNGFKVINIGIKADINDFIKAFREHKADAIGMSGLLVKSTNVMRENLIELKKEGINVPILLGGAALTKRFIDEYCRTNYDGAIFYCKDAFDGITSMSRIEKGNLDTNLSKNEIEYIEQEIKIVEIPPIDKIKMPKSIEVPKAPFIGRKVFVSNKNNSIGEKRFYEYIQSIAFEWINERILFKQRWGFKGKGIEKETYEKQIQNEVKPAFERLKREFIQKSLFEPTIIYGYFKCKSLENSLIVYDESNEISFEFPRQNKEPFRALNDYFRDENAILPLSIVSAGTKISEYEKELFAKGDFKEYYLVHGLGVELAEALAEIIHKQVRIELNILKDEEANLSQVKMVGYLGCRYSFGYPACPDLELNRGLFQLLKPEEFGITLSETFQIHPEQSTSAIISYHQEAIYYNI